MVQCFSVAVTQVLSVLRKLTVWTEAIVSSISNSLLPDRRYSSYTTSYKEGSRFMLSTTETVLQAFWKVVEWPSTLLTSNPMSWAVAGTYKILDSCFLSKCICTIPWTHKIHKKLTYTIVSLSLFRSKLKVSEWVWITCQALCQPLELSASNRQVLCSSMIDTYPFIRYIKHLMCQ